MPIDPTTVTGFRDRWITSSLAQANGTAVTAWTSANGKTVSGSGGSQPTFVTNVIGTVPGVLFDGIDDALAGNGTDAAGFLRNVTAQTVYCVAQFSNAGTLTDNNMWAVSRTDSTANSRYALALTNNKVAVTIRRLDSDSSTSFLGNTAFPIGTPAILTNTHSFSTAVTTMFVNGTQVDQGTSIGTTGSTQNLDPSRINIGSKPSGTGAAWAGYIFEILVYDAEHSAPQRSQVHTYVQDRYGIVVSDYQAPPTIVSIGRSTATETATIVTKKTKSNIPTGRAIASESAQVVTSSLRTFPAAPTLSATLSGPASVLLTWTRISGATGYDIERNGSALVSVDGGTVTSYTDATVSGGQTYTWRIRPTKLTWG